ncbi:MULTISPECIES: coenzyme F420-0:L-glutamate ligase [Methanothrix]|uniref:coenzyme F420-0:L-glutamate ligase n=1 Tax=Methanothrix TaxID=2222 RepID=UPI0023EFC8AC|nr:MULTISPECIES: coenzyme F420-0:L-glutamate ligase [Methanothrix]
MQVLGIKSDLVRPGDDLVEFLVRAMNRSGQAFQDGDILVVSESIVATSEGRVVDLDKIQPGDLAISLAGQYKKDPREMELILRESDEIVGGIPGVVLTLNNGFLFPNAGIDNSNAPPGHVVLFPADPKGSAIAIRERMANGKKIGVIIGDSRTHPLRLGCVGVALACSGLEAVEDARGQKDLFGRELKITRKAIADNLVSAAQIVMGEGDEGIPAAIIRDSGVPIKEASGEIPTIPPAECMYIGALGIGPRPYAGGYDQLIECAGQAIARAYAPYSRFRVGAALLTKKGNVYSAGNIENASTGAGICAERVAISQAIASGEREFEAIAIVGDGCQPISPCGICRQSLIEFGEDIIVIMANCKGDALTASSRDLLPRAFTGKWLE